MMFSPYLEKFVIIFLDNILVFSDNYKEHVMNVRGVREILRRNKLYVKISKCIFSVNESAYLRFILKGDVVAIKPHKSSAILTVDDFVIQKGRAIFPKAD